MLSCFEKTLASFQTMKQVIPSDFQKKTCWCALSGVSITVLLALLCGSVWLFGHLFSYLEPVLLPVIIAGIAAYLLNPIVLWMQRRRLSRLWAVIVTMVLAAGIFAGLACSIVPPVVRQTSSLIEKREAIWNAALEKGNDVLQNSIVIDGVDALYKKTLRDVRAEGVSDEDYRMMEGKMTPDSQIPVILEANSSIFMEKAASWFTASRRVLSGSLAIAVGLIMSPVFLFYFLMKSESIRDNWHNILPLRASGFKNEVVETLTEINEYIKSFVRGQMLVSLIDGVLLAIALRIYGLPYAYTIAAAAALLGIIPYLGTLLTAIPAVLIAWCTAEGDPLNASIIVACIFFAVSQFDGWVIQPRVVGNSVGLHEMTVMFSVLFWSLVLGGVVGALLAVPLTAALKVLFRRYVWHRAVMNDQTAGSESPARETA